MKKNNKKGFTLAELLIVVAIIAVLVAVAIPVFSAQLKKSRATTDLANIRSGYAAAVSGFLMGTYKNGNTATLQADGTLGSGNDYKTKATSGDLGTEVSYIGSFSTASGGGLSWEKDKTIIYNFGEDGVSSISTG